MVATGHPFEVLTATYHPSIAGDVAGHSSNTQLSFQQLSECSSAVKHIRIVLVLEAHEGPNAQV